MEEISLIVLVTIQKSMVSTAEYDTNVWYAYKMDRKPHSIGYAVHKESLISDITSHRGW